MAVMISEVYDALRYAGAGEEKARKAAETMAVSTDRSAKIEARLHLLTWMVGVVLTLACGVFTGTNLLVRAFPAGTGP
jgi:hypothetical protein